MRVDVSPALLFQIEYGKRLDVPHRLHFGLFGSRLSHRSVGRIGVVFSDVAVLYLPYTHHRCAPFNGAFENAYVELPQRLENAFLYVGGAVIYHLQPSTAKRTGHRGYARRRHFAGRLRLPQHVAHLGTDRRRFRHFHVAHPRLYENRAVWSARRRSEVLAVLLPVAWVFRVFLVYPPAFVPAL